MKTIDLTIRRITEICDKNKGACTECPLYESALNCFELHKDFGKVYRNKLEEEEVDVE